MRLPLEKQLRSKLEAAVEKARDVAELAAKEELDRLGVGEKQAPDYLSPDQRDQRNRLRAHGRFLGDIRRASGEQEVFLLVTEIAYEHWHRMLFSRFLAENDLLMYEDGVTALAISDCFDLAEEEVGDSSKGWQYAANYASKMLPQIFRNDSPALELEFSPNHQKTLEKLLEGLDEDTFQAQDSLGWVYQYWQSKRKDEVNKSEVKIGAKELSPVTQLFTEPYMVNFLLDNALGAWWANQQLTEQDYANASSEQELRNKAAIDGVPLEYLRFVRPYTPEQQALIDSEEGKPIEKPEPAGAWEPAAGKFEQWPENLSEFKTLDPCCGSGHFLVSVFLMLVPIRMQREGLTEQQAIDVVLGENIHGLELDQRCVEIAVFALALEAWRYQNSGGYRELPDLHLACSGLSVKAAKEEWKAVAVGKKNLAIALDWMHRDFEDAPFLGSLINPKKSLSAKLVDWEDLSKSIEAAISVEREDNIENSTRLEASVVAQGIVKAVSLLGSEFTLVLTNVPYLATRKQDKKLVKYLEDYYFEERYDLAVAMLSRCLDFCSESGTVLQVSPQSWNYLSSYKGFREKLLVNSTVNSLVRLGAGAFESISGQVVNVCLGIHSQTPSSNNSYYSLDVSHQKTTQDKAKELAKGLGSLISQSKQLSNLDAVILASDADRLDPLSDMTKGLAGILNGDAPRFRFRFWEVMDIGVHRWSLLQENSSGTDFFNGRSAVIL